MNLHIGALQLAVEQQQCVFNDRVHIYGLDLFCVPVQAQHLPHDTCHALGLRLQNAVDRHGAFRNGADQQVNSVLNRLHGVVDLMGNGGGQPSGSGELLDFQHAALDFELFHLAQGRQVAQHRDRIGDLAAFIEDLAGAGIVFNFLLQ